MSTWTELSALVPREDVAEVVGDLEAHGIHAAEIEVLDAEPGTYQEFDETLHDDAFGARHGARAGAAAGLLVGLVVALLLGAFDEFGRAIGIAVATTGFGALVGGMIGLQRSDPMDDDPVHELAPDDDAQIVRVTCRHFLTRAHRVLRDHDARILDSLEPVRRAADVAGRTVDPE